MRNLFDETRINNITLRNRIIRSATWEAMATDEGYVTDRLIRVYEDLAAGEVGLIITGFASVIKDQQPKPAMLGIYDDSFITDLRRLTESVHDRSGQIVIQIACGSTQTDSRSGCGVIWGPSAVAEMSSGLVAREMSKDNIHMLVTAFGDAAARAKAAGFDGVQIHCAHGYFLSQFLNPHHNRRTDEYGGPIENRSRIIIEVYNEIRRRVGQNYGILVKINAEDFVNGGASFDDCEYVCNKLSAFGVDAIEISGGIRAAGGKLGWARPHINSTEKEGYFATYATKIAEATPVILVGGLRSLGVMETLLGSTNISYFAMSRPLLAEPDLATRWKSGDRTTSRCISCNRCWDPKGNICIFLRSCVPNQK